MSLLPRDNLPSNSGLADRSNNRMKETSKIEESDDELFTVPDMEEVKTKKSSSPKRKRGRNPIDKEYRRLKRLLRNRVSAQQARERKKVYVTELEWRAKELQDHNFKLEEKISTLVNENTMLRKILMNSRPNKVDESAETKA